MIKQLRLKSHEAEHLGLKPGKDSNQVNPKYRLSEDQQRKLYLFRGYDAGLIEECITTGISINKVSSYWHKSEHFSLRVKEDKEDNSLQDFKNDLIAEIKDYSPTYPTIRRKKSEDSHLLIIDIADLHINKYAEAYLTGADYNSKIAVERAISGTMGLINKASGFDIDKIVFVIGNDVLNTDNLSKSTTKFTPQDTDVNWYKAFNIAKDCYIKCIELCMQVADVDIIHCPSNHDYMTGCLLGSTIHAWFRNSKNITFDISPKYRKFYQYYGNMIEFEHGDKGKMANLPLQMANEEPQMWANTKFRYGYLHHVHHQDKTQFKSGKDFTGVNVTYLRSPSSADLWHAESGYSNMVAVEGFLHSKDMGRISHITHYF